MQLVYNIRQTHRSSRNPPIIGDRGLAVADYGRLLAAHLVIGFVIAEDALMAVVVGAHLAASLGRSSADMSPW
ncbi:DUF5073 family protein [Mycobacterium tuberculosis]|uniref:DUF5073 family protein n=1 Tax=Mycobacterium tuberculosis TaxID=1773 RepID=UPI00255C0554|nr:DUF5073 family protein [Mycobacterium tuberculosis]WIX97161.1 DUF5073 family protein [Mycobacterium tuberculosis]